MLSFPQLRGNFRHGDCRVIAGNAVLGDQFMASGKITKRAVDALISSGQHDLLWDDSLKGFGAKRTKDGAVSYVLQFRLGGRESKTRRYTIGSHVDRKRVVTGKSVAVVVDPGGRPIIEQTN